MEYSLKQAAEALGVSKSTVRRLMAEHLDSEIGQTSYRGHVAYTISETGLAHLRAVLSAQDPIDETIHEANPSASSAPGSEPNASDETSTMIGILRAELEAKNQQIQSLTAALERAQESIQTAQALHAATAEQLRRLTAGDQERERSTQESNPPEAPTVKPSLRERLRYLFTGETR